MPDPEDRLRELSQTATPAPWWGDSDGFGTIFAGSTKYNEETHDEQPWLYDPRDATPADAALIAYQRNLAEPLADVVAAARKYLFRRQNPEREERFAAYETLSDAIDVLDKLGATDAA